LHTVDTTKAHGYVTSCLCCIILNLLAAKFTHSKLNLVYKSFLFLLWKSDPSVWGLRVSLSLETFQLVPGSSHFDHYFEG